VQKGSVGVEPAGEPSVANLDPSIVGVVTDMRGGALNPLENNFNFVE